MAETTPTEFMPCEKCGKPTTFKHELNKNGKPKFCSDCYNPKNKSTTISPMAAPDSKTPPVHPKQTDVKKYKAGKGKEKDHDHKQPYHNESNDSELFGRICKRHTKKEIEAWVAAHDTLGTFLKDEKK